MASLAGNGDDSQNMQKIKIKFGKEIFEVTISKEKTYANLLDLLPALSGVRKIHNQIIWTEIKDWFTRIY